MVAVNRVRELLVDLVVSLSSHVPSYTHSDGMAISLDTDASMRRKSNVVKPTNLSIGIEDASRELEAAAYIAARIVITTPVFSTASSTAEPTAAILKYSSFSSCEKTLGVN